MSTGTAQKQDIARAGRTVSAMTLLSRISGFVRDVLVSYFFGAQEVADAFFVAFRIPNFFRRLFAEGAFNQAFVPVLAQYRAAGEAELHRFVALVGGNLSLILFAVVVLGVSFPDVLISVFAPGFREEEVRFTLASDLVRLTFPYLGFISLTAFCGALLNTHNYYAIPAFTPVLLNATLITAMVFGAVALDEPIFALAWGVFAAGIVQLLFQTPSLKRLHLLIRPRLGVEHEGVRQVGRLLIPAVLAASVGQVNSLIDTMLASTLMTGAISWLYYSDRLLELPIGLVAVALGTVMLPNLSRLAMAENTSGFSATLNWGMRMGLILGVPASVSLYFLALPLIATIFFHGQMTVISVSMAALSLQAFAAGVIPMILVKIIAPAYFAYHDTRSPFQYAAIAVAVNIVLNLVLIIPLGHVGLALATAASAWVNFGLLYRGMVRRAFLVPDRQMGLLFVKSLAAAAGMIAILLLMTPQDSGWLTFSVGSRVMWTSAIVVVGGGVYGALLFILGVRPSDLRHRV
ncbi:MAG: murein biosynthesis integral membrane protein MurJ [Proteobacteria bacterium]|nr:murein biosynthesis integral membrane protein MurJ [Pseudomonadota bacterium]